MSRAVSPGLNSPPPSGEPTGTVPGQHRAGTRVRDADPDRPTGDARCVDHGTPAPPGDESPVTMLDIELHRPLRGIAPWTSDGRPRNRVWALVRFFTEPVGAVLLDVPDTGISRAELAGAIDRELGAALRPRLAACGLDGLSIDGAAPVTLPPLVVRRREVLADPPAITVVVCTRDRPAALARCLQSLQCQQYPAFRVLVVDNAPATRAARDLVRSAAATGLVIEYVEEPRPGLLAARRRASRHAGGQLLAFLDDDTVADPYWLAEIARAFADHPGADAVCGTIVPAELRTEAQWWCAHGGRHGLGRGFAPASYPAVAAHRTSALPAALRTGGNMAFRPGVLERIDAGAPGAGTAGPDTCALGEDDTHAFRLVLLAGGTVVHQPGALVRHHHRPRPGQPGESAPVGGRPGRAAGGPDQPGTGRGGRTGADGRGPGRRVARAVAYTMLALADPRRMWPLLPRTGVAPSRGQVGTHG